MTAAFGATTLAGVNASAPFEAGSLNIVSGSQLQLSGTANTSSENVAGSVALTAIAGGVKLVSSNTFIDTTSLKGNGGNIDITIGRASSNDLDYLDSQGLVFVNVCCGPHIVKSGSTLGSGGDVRIRQLAGHQGTGTSSVTFDTSAAMAGGSFSWFTAGPSTASCGAIRAASPRTTVAAPAGAR